MPLLDVQHVRKIYQTRFRTNQVEALKDIHFSVEKGEYVAIMGESGSGKTTLLNILAMLDKPTEGKVWLNHTDTSKLKHKEIATYRREKLGFVFQDFNLLDTLSVKDNISLPLVLSKQPIHEIKARLEEVLAKLSITSLKEPTGALDSKSASTLLDIFEAINRQGQTILMVTHSTTAASRAQRVLFIRDGILYNQIFRGDKTDRQMFAQISDTLTVMANGGGQV